MMVLSGGGRILWYQPREGVVHDLNLQRYRGEPVSRTTFAPRRARTSTRSSTSATAWPAASYRATDTGRTRTNSS